MLRSSIATRKQFVPSFSCNSPTGLTSFGVSELDWSCFSQSCSSAPKAAFCSWFIVLNLLVPCSCVRPQPPSRNHPGTDTLRTPRAPRENRTRRFARTTRRRADGTTRKRPPRPEGGRGRSCRPVVASSLAVRRGRPPPHPRLVDNRTKRRQDKRSRPCRRRNEGSSGASAEGRRRCGRLARRPRERAWPEIRHSNWRNRSKSAISDGGFSLTTNGFRGRMPTS